MTSTSRSNSLAVRIALIPAVALVVAAGVWFTGAVVSDDIWVARIATGLWLGVAGAAALVAVRRQPNLLLPVLGTYLVTAAAIGGWLAWESLVDDEVNEAVAVGVPASQAGSPAAARAEGTRNLQLASGSFAALAHATSGDAAVVELAAGGRVLTLTGFETDPGPDLRVYLATDEAASDFEDLGALKGNVGNQQYEVPDGVDLARYDTVVIWCRAFSVGFGQAPLRES